ncbi:Hypothetical predicted protein [Podarcis lilfordi]|uniref:Uncharacterized protein n=1 Tax=Podarcis lilfordi TaxID=74358 RepID=A0AA35NWE4_9SAUR|nr:Hypothetical predicted protein [Podarcis lilfordi]
MLEKPRARLAKRYVTSKELPWRLARELLTHASLFGRKRSVISVTARLNQSNDKRIDATGVLVGSMWGEEHGMWARGQCGGCGEARRRVFLVSESGRRRRPSARSRRLLSSNSAAAILARQKPRGTAAGHRQRQRSAGREAGARERGGQLASHPRPKPGHAPAVR